MVHRGLHILLTLGFSLLWAGCLGPSSLEEAVRREQLAPDAVVRLSEGAAVAARRDATDVSVLWFDHEAGDWETQEIASSRIPNQASSLRLMSMGGETGLDWNSFVYGTAPAAVSAVQLDGFDGEGGHVSDGVWVIALREKDISPNDLHWKFVDATGLTVESGDGTFPPDA